MATDTGIWVDALIAQHQDWLVTTLAERTHAEVPFYQSRELAQVRQGFSAYFTALRSVLQTDTITPMRTYLHGLLAARLPQGADGGVYIQLLDRAEEQVQQLIRQTDAADPQRAGDALRLIGTIARNSRLIASEANLAALLNGNAPARRSDPQS